jgi:hypothetical protein
MSHNPIRCFDGNAQPHEPFWRARNAAETGGEPEIELYGVISEYSWFEDDCSRLICIRSATADPSRSALIRQAGMWSPPVSSARS